LILVNNALFVSHSLLTLCEVLQLVNGDLSVSLFKCYIVHTNFGI